MSEENNQHPKLTAVLKPEWNTDRVDRMNVTVRADIRAAAGEELFYIQSETVTIPFCKMEDLRISDAQGEITFDTVQREQYPIKITGYTAKRQTQGEVQIAYTVYPREVAKNQRYGPYFDFRSEEGGANGAGVTFLPMLPEGQYDIALDWDLTGMPDGSGGVWSFGEGKQRRTDSSSALVYSYYAVGLLHSCTENDFGFYWFGSPSFPIAEAAGRVKKMFAAMAEFFGDKDTAYRVFARKDPFEQSGGTALTRSFMFGYNDTLPPTVESLQNLLAHEMVHNWPHMNDEPYGSTTWYTEGTAEYYSVMLPYRNRIVSLEDTLRQIQKRTDQYYTNPTNRLSNREAAKQYWTDRRTQRLAYGRGFFFLAYVDAKVHRATGGNKSLDDVVKPLTGRYMADGSGNNEDFISMVREVGGIDIRKEFEAMEQGCLPVPDPDSFDGLFDRDEIETAYADTGESAISYRWRIRERKKDEA